MKIHLSDHFTYKRLLRFVFPTVIMMIVSSVYSVVDGFFVSNFVGKNSFAAVNMITPVLMAMAACGYMIGAGGSAIIAKTLGEGDKERANQYFSMLIYTIIAIGTVLGITVFIFMRPIAIALGASDLILEDCIVYGKILVVSNTAHMLQNCCLNFLVAAERPNFGLAISVIAGFCNIFLDYLLICVFDFGLVGAAIATAISQLVGCMIPLLYFTFKKDSILKLVKTKLYLRALLKSFTNGFSELLTNISASIVGILFNFQLMKFAAEDGVAAYGVIMYVHFIFMALYFGFSVGSAPVISFHYGAQNHSELKGLFKKSIVITGITSISLTLLAELLSAPLSQLFVGYDKELYEMTFNAFKIYSFSFLFAGINVFGSAFFTALNNGLLSAIISFLRTLVIQVAAIFILPLIFEIDGIWVAVAVAEGLTMIITVFLFVISRKKYHYA